MNMKILTLIFLFFCSVQAQGILTDPSAECSQLASKAAQIPNVTVNFAQFVKAGTNLTFQQDVNLTTCDRPSQVVSVDLCRLAMAVSTSNRSGITLEAWLPTNWTGRFLSTGNGGLSGCIQYEDMAYTVGFGFATVGANNGHNGTSGLAFYNNLDVVDDFADRSMHTGVVVGKQVSQMYYGATHKKSYYLGCSTGGRQGWKAVQDHPDDFDGLVVGCPAVDFVSLGSWSAHFFPILGNSSSETFVSAAKWAVIHTEILNQCDSIDGVVDGIIEDPLLCQFRPEALQCAPGITNTTNCLTSPQVSAVRLVFTDFYGSDGKLIFPRMQPGSELIATDIYYNGKSFPYSDDWFRYVVFNDPDWDPTTFNLSTVALALAQNPFNIQTFNGNISSFQATGGKILHWHGQQDFIISSDNSPRYYNHVSQTMGLPSSDLDDFYRFFRVSGTGHCGTGVGAHQIGNTALESSAIGNITQTPQNNVLLRIVDWVENSNAPETITGTKFVNDDPTQGVAFVRDHCRYPARNVYVGPGNYTLAENWKCVEDAF